MKKFLRILGIIVVLAGGFLLLMKNPGWTVYQKTSPSKPISVEDAYKSCNEKSCISTPINMDAFMVIDNDSLHGVAALTDAKKRNGYIMSRPSISLIPKEEMTLVEKYNFINRDDYLLGNGILKVQVNGVLQYDPLYQDGKIDHIKLTFAMEDLKVISRNGCLENGTPYSTACFVPMEYIVDLDTAYNDLINSELYRNAVKESKSRDLVSVSYDSNVDRWIFEVDYTNTPSPGSCKDTFEVGKNVIFYKRSCIGNLKGNSFSLNESIGNSITGETIAGTSSSINYFASIPDGRELNNCVYRIGKIDALVSSIASQKGVIKTITVKDDCGGERMLYSKDEYLKTNSTNDDVRVTKNIVSENDTYVVYALVDTNWDVPSMEYPIVVYNKKDQTNKLLTIRRRFPIIGDISGEGIVNIKLRNYEEPEDYQLNFNIITDRILSE